MKKKEWKRAEEPVASPVAHTRHTHTTISGRVAKEEIGGAGFCEVEWTRTLTTFLLFSFSSFSFFSLPLVSTRGNRKKKKNLKKEGVRDSRLVKPINSHRDYVKTFLKYVWKSRV